eukprot:TRINITY_DN5795_c0_g1_i1.p1 TRINITY_DN5795_c0_g1~~TRINITY_DN5795_c0_g1_i1.p1  ORF type:complete len:177 (+),score=16.98 TRINITY_DN5795_c0_g1_i1:44-532(+)
MGAVINAVVLLITCVSLTRAQYFSNDGCAVFTSFSGFISGEFNPPLCWHINPVVSPGFEPIDMSFQFLNFSLGQDHLMVYQGESIKGALVGDFTLNVNPGKVGVSGSKMFLVLTGDVPCSFNFAWRTDPVKQLKPAILMLLSAFVLAIIPAGRPRGRFHDEC